MDGMHAVILDGRKLIRRTNGKSEAYDLSRDPGERDDLYGREDFSSLEAELEYRIERNRAKASDYSPGEEANLDPETVERLRELGYIE